MSIVCTICQDLVTERPQQLSNTEEVEIRAMLCGHLFHTSCIREWFQKGGEQIQYGTCPCCKKPGSIQDGIRVFPSGDEESQAISEKINHAKEQSEQIKNVNSELEQLTAVLEDVGCHLENEKIEHDILKYKHAQLLSEFDEFKRLTEESTKLMETQESKWKEIIDKMNKDHQEATDKIRIDLENEYIDRINELEKKANIDLATKDCDMLSKRIKMMEQNHLREVRNYEQRLGSMSHKSNKGCQTDGRDAALLQARLVSYKSCKLHMESEIRCLEEEYGKLQLLQPIEAGFARFMDDGLYKETENGSNDQQEQEQQIHPRDDESDAIMCVDLGDEDPADVSISVEEFIPLE